MMSRFRRESNSTASCPEPISEGEGGRGGNHEEFSAVHARDKCGSDKERESGEEDAAGEAERIRVRMFLAEDRQGGSDGTINEQARDDGKHGVAGKISGDGKDQEEGGKNQNRNMRSAKAGMNPGEEGGEVAALAHGKSDARSMQHVGAEIAVGGYERACGNE